MIDKHVNKGDRLLVEGRLRTESWETDGNKRSKLSGVVEQFSFANGPKGQNEVAAAQQTLSAATEASPF